MNFKSAGAVESTVYCMLLADQPRANNRALINALFNGAPPYSEAEIDQNHGATNVNDLSATKIDADARAQFDNAFLVPDPLFTVNLDFGPAYKRLEWSAAITKAINRRIKNSEKFVELQQSVFANVVLHGPGPSIWNDREHWLQDPLGVEDVLVPGNTLRSMENLEMFAVYRQYTAGKLWRMTHGPQVDVAWNMPLVDQCIAWVDKQAQQLNGDQWPDVWFPEKMEERLKSDNGLYAGDRMPTVNCWDFYFWGDNGERSGWNRRIILDAWGQPGVGGMPWNGLMSKEVGKGRFLFDPGDRVYADKLDQIIHFQSGDASAVAPFRYHSQRSLGYLLYAVCHLQNRLYCKFTDSVFESLLQYFRINNPADMDRLTKIDLIDKGLLPEGMQFVRPEERWQVNEGLVDRAFQMNRIKMNDMSASFSQDLDKGSSNDETATRTMAKVNATAALVGAILNRAYVRERFRYIEICRRFCIEDSCDMDVQKARLEMLKAGVPEEALDSERWDIQPTKVIGQGNKILGSAMVDSLMQVYPQLEPTAQKKVLRDYIAVKTDNWSLAQILVPEEPQISNSIHDSELAFGTLMQGVAVNPREGLNAVEVAETIVRLMQTKIQEIQQSDNLGTPQDVRGLTMASQYASAFIQQLAQDKTQVSTVKMLNDALGKLGNEVKGFAQRQQQAAQQAAQQNGQAQDPEGQAKVQTTMALGQTKIELAAKSAAQKQAQKELAFQQKMDQDQQKHAVKLVQDDQQHALDTHTSMREHAAQLAATARENEHAMQLQQAQADAAPETPAE